MKKKKKKTIIKGETALGIPLLAMEIRNLSLEPPRTESSFGSVKKSLKREKEREAERERESQREKIPQREREREGDR